MTTALDRLFRAHFCWAGISAIVENWSSTVGLKRLGFQLRSGLLPGARVPLCMLCALPAAQQAALKAWHLLYHASVT